MCPVIWCDNLGESSLASYPVFHARTKHIEIYLHIVRDQVLAKKLDIRYVDSTNQIADLLTKPLDSPLFLALRHKLNLCSTPLKLRGDIRSHEATPPAPSTSGVAQPSASCSLAVTTAIT